MFRKIDSKASLPKEIVNKKEEGQAAFIKYCDKIEPSVEYLKVKLDLWLERNKPEAWFKKFVVLSYIFV